MRWGFDLLFGALIAMVALSIAGIDRQDDRSAASTSSTVYLVPKGGRP